MPAHTAKQVHQLFAKYFSAGDLDALMSLYEPDAVMVQQSGLRLNGLAEIRANLEGFLAIKCQMILKVTRIIQSGDIALLLSNWTIQGTDQDGGALELAGQTSDVARRQADSTWLLVIDNPYGAVAADLVQ